MKTITSNEFEQLRHFLYENYGINLTEKKKTLVMSRLNKVLSERKISSYQDYIDLVKTDPSGDIVSELLNRITTNHTFFFRENQHFEFFRKSVLPELEERYGKDKDLRIWSAGCSTGDEPYTLSILMMEHFMLRREAWDLQVLGTDISRRVLDFGKTGIYDLEAIKELPEKWARTYFHKPENGLVQIRDEIRGNVIFRRFNLMNPFPFKKPFHVIFCRNVMIYFDKKTKRKLTKKFYDALEPGGYLFIGHSESIDLKDLDFTYVRPAIYRKD